MNIGIHLFPPLPLTFAPFCPLYTFTDSLHTLHTLYTHLKKEEKDFA